MSNQTTDHGAVLDTPIEGDIVYSILDESMNFIGDIYSESEGRMVPVASPIDNPLNTPLSVKYAADEGVSNRLPKLTYEMVGTLVEDVPTDSPDVVESGGGALLTVKLAHEGSNTGESYSSIISKTAAVPDPSNFNGGGVTDRNMLEFPLNAFRNQAGDRHYWNVWAEGAVSGNTVSRTLRLETNAVEIQPPQGGDGFSNIQPPEEPASSNITIENCRVSAFGVYAGFVATIRNNSPVPIEIVLEGSVGGVKSKTDGKLTLAGSSRDILAVVNAPTTPGEYETELSVVDAEYVV